MSISRAFATRLKALREEKGLSQEELGNAIGISRGSISFYEKQSRTPDITVLDKLSKFFNVSLDYLMGYSLSKTREGINIENIIGLSEDSIKKLREYRVKYTPPVIEILNKIIQDDSIIEVCRLISEYNRERVIANRLQSAIFFYLRDTHLDIHSKKHLKEFLDDMCIEITNEQLDEIDDFIMTYFVMLLKCNVYTAGIFDLVSIQEHNEALLVEAEKVFSEIVDTLTYCEEV